MWVLRTAQGRDFKLFEARRDALLAWTDVNLDAILEEIEDQLCDARRRDGDAATRLRHLRRVANTPLADVLTADLEALLEATRPNVEENDGCVLDEVAVEPRAAASPSQPYVVAIDSSSESEGEL